MTWKMNRISRFRQNIERSQVYLDTLAAGLADDAVWVDPAVTEEWNDVRQAYFPEWPDVVGDPDHVYVSRCPKHGGQRVEGAVGSHVPIIIVRDGFIRKSRARRRALLIHEAAHVVAGPHIPSGLDLRPHLLDALGHGPAWQERMHQAARHAYLHREGWVGNRLCTDIAVAKLAWDERKEELDRIAASFPFLLELM